MFRHYCKLELDQGSCRPGSYSPRTRFGSRSILLRCMSPLWHHAWNTNARAPRSRLLAAQIRSGTRHPSSRIRTSCSLRGTASDVVRQQEPRLRTLHSDTPKAEPVFVVQEELPVADDRTPHQQKRHGRCEWSKVWVVYRGPVVALVEGSHHQPIVHIGWNANLLQDAAKEVLGLTRRQNQ
jgi:hypothetical protein